MCIFNKEKRKELMRKEKSVFMLHECGLKKYSSNEKNGRLIYA